MIVTTQKLPLSVDLDGTLIRTDSLHECLLAIITDKPLNCIVIPFWLRHGKVKFKEIVADLINDLLDISTNGFCQGLCGAEMTFLIPTETSKPNRSNSP